MSRTIYLTNCRVDLDRRVVAYEDGSVRLTTREAAILSYLVANPNRTVSRDEIHSAVWGYGPGIITRVADDTIRRLRPKIREDPRDPAHIFSVHGEGYRFVPLASEPESVSSPSRTAVPIPRTPFFGRTAEIEVLLETVEQGALLTTILGPGGMGKTRLALELGRRRVADQQRTWFFDMSEARSLTELIDVLVQGLGITLGDVSSPQAAIGHIAQALSTTGSSLLILDNVEQVRDCAVELIDGLLAGAPAVQLVATSRFRLEIEGERIITLRSLDPEQCVALFEDRARALSHTFQLSAEDAVVLRVLVERLDGLPLAIELAAARTTMMTVSELNDTLAVDSKALRAGSRGRPPRQQTLESTLWWTWDLLEPWAQSALAQCAVFRHGFALWAAEEVVDLSAFSDAPDTVRVIETLCDCSLLGADVHHAADYQLRFSMYEMVRHFAVQRMDTQEVAAVQARMRTALVRWATPTGDSYAQSDGDDMRNRTRVEFDNLFDIARYAPMNEERAAALVSLRGVLCHGLHRTIGVWEMIEGVDIDALEPDSRVRAQISAASCAYRLGRLDDALALVEAGLSGARALEMSHAEVLAMLGRATYLLERGARSEAEAEYLAALALADSIGEPTLIGRAKMVMGSHWSRTGQFDRAFEFLGAAAVCFEGKGMEEHLGLIQAFLGQAYMTSDCWSLAAKHAAQALDVGRSIGNIQMQMLALNTMGASRLAAGRRNAMEAHQLFEQAHLIAQGTLVLAPKIYTAAGMAQALQAAGTAKAAHDLMSEVLEQCVTAGLTAYEMQCREELVTFAAENGWLELAETLGLAALEDMGPEVPMFLRAIVMHALAGTFLELGRFDEAAALARSSVQGLTEAGAALHSWKGLLIGAVLALREGEGASAAALLEEAAALTRSGDYPRRKCVTGAFQSIALTCGGDVEEAQVRLDAVRARFHTTQGRDEEAELLLMVAGAFVASAQGDGDGAEAGVATCAQAGLGADGEVVTPSPGGRYQQLRWALELYDWWVSA